MNLKNLRKNYSRLLGAFKSAGVTLTESQKEDLDTFMLALESTIQKTKRDTVKATRKVVEKKLSDEYRKVFESILAHQAEHAGISAKIQRKATALLERKKMSGKLDDYLGLYVEEVLPKKTVVDYGKMKKLENIMESMKDMLLVNDEAVEAKVAEISDKLQKEAQEAKDRAAKLEKQLNESMERRIQLRKKLEAAKAKELLESKTKDLPLFEAKKVKARLENAKSAEEVEKKFSKILESVKEEEDEEAKEEETSLEEEISNIIESDDAADDSEKKDGNANDDLAEDEGETDGNEGDELEEGENGEDGDYNTEVDLDEDGDELDGDEKIDESYMNAWIRRAASISPLR